MEWLESNNVSLDLVNHNGHGAIHKAAQRGQSSVCHWLWENVLLPKMTAPVANDELGERHAESPDHTTALENMPKQHPMTNTAIQMIAPDQEGYCPSDLAGMEGHEELAQWLANQEIRFIKTVLARPNKKLQCDPLQVEWLQSTLLGVNHHMSLNQKHRVWERHGGVRRMRSSMMSSQS